MARHIDKRAHNQEIKARLKVLKKKGLYSGDLRRAEPTRYAKDLARKFADVVNERAQVVSIPAVKHGRVKGIAEARREAKELASEFGTTMRAKGSKLIVRTAVASERVVYDRAAHTVVTRRRDDAGRVITHEYVRHREGVPGGLPPLAADQTYALPFSRGRDGISYVYRATPDEILALASEYENKAFKPYVGATGYIQLAYIGSKRKKTRAKPKAKTKGKKTRRQSAKVIDLAAERRKRSK